MRSHHERSGKVALITGVGGTALRNFGGLGGRPLASLCALVSSIGAERTSVTKTAMTHKNDHLKFNIL